MRSGGCAVQQALAADAAAVMRQAVSVARRRGHAQVTPLHVASAMLAGGDASLLRAACLRSRPHPLQCKALELCFNVALNRLVTTAGGAHPAAVFWSSSSQPPALSNALAAAFKRAQASQRRGGGSSETNSNGNSKVELEQLVVSVLDDPSVSRVMREAGFSSAEVKVCVEKAAAVSPSDHHSSNITATTTSSSCGGAVASPLPQNPNPGTTATKLDPTNKSSTKPDVVAGDAARVLDLMASGGGGWGQKRCVAVVGERVEAVVKAVMDKVSKGVDERLKNMQFVPVSIASFARMTRAEVESTAGELHLLVRRGAAAGKGVVLVLEDLGFAAEAWVRMSSSRKRGSGGGGDHDQCCDYCPVEHAVVELGGLVRGGGGDHDVRFWVLAFGTHAAYATCRAGQPSLEDVLEMHPVVVPPGGGLASSLAGDSELTYCGTDIVAAAPATVPSWFRRCQGPGPVLSGSGLTLSFSPPPPASSMYGFPHCDTNLLDPRQLRLMNHRHVNNGLVMAESPDQQWPAMSPNPGGSSNSASVSSGGTTGRRRRPRFTELTAENLKILCGALEARVPRHGDVAPGIASAVLRRRSGVTTRPAARPRRSATWLVFRGGDNEGKAAVARELARLVFGSYDDFANVEFIITEPARSAGSSSGGGGGEPGRLKRRRSSPEKAELGRYVQRFHDAVRENPHRVVLIDGVERSEEEDCFIKSAIQTGTVRGRNGDVASLEDAIVVLSCEAFESSWSRAPPPRRRRLMTRDDIGNEEDDDGGTERGETQPRFSLDLNACAIDGELEEGSSLLSDCVDEILDAVDGVFLFQ